MLGLVLYNISFKDEANITEKDYETIINRLHKAIDKQEFPSLTVINSTIKDICANFGNRPNYKSSESADTLIQNYSSTSKRKFHLYKASKAEAVYDVHNSDIGSIFVIGIYEKSTNDINKSIRIVKCDINRCTKNITESASVYIKYSVNLNGKYSYEITPIKTIEESKALIEKLTELNEEEELAPPITVHNAFLYNQKKPSHEMMHKVCNRMQNIMTDQQVTMTTIAHKSHIGIGTIRELPTHMDGLDTLVKLFKQLGYNIDFTITKIDEDG